MLVPGLYSDGLSLYMYVLLHTGIYRDIHVCTGTYQNVLVHTGMYRYILVYTWIYRYVPVHTGMYRYIPGKTKILYMHYNWSRTSDLQHTNGWSHRYAAGAQYRYWILETRYTYIIIANGSVWYLLAEVGHPALVPPRPPLRPLRHGPSH